jgi:hypothetical protein
MKMNYLNYLDFNEGRRLDAKRLQKLVDKSVPITVQGINSWFTKVDNFTQNRELVGLACEGNGDTAQIREAFNDKSIIASDNGTFFKKRPSGLYMLEGVVTRYKLEFLHGHNLEEHQYKVVLCDGDGEPRPISLLVLPTHMFLPLYVVHPDLSTYPESVLARQTIGEDNE